jgi:hypothetical protein
MLPLLQKFATDWWDVITVGVIVTYFAYTTGRWIRRGEIRYETPADWTGWRTASLTVRKGDGRLRFWGNIVAFVLIGILMAFVSLAWRIFLG